MISIKPWISEKKIIVLLIFRIVLVLSIQLLFSLFLAWEKVIPWWPFTMIVTDTICFFTLRMLLRAESKSFRSIQFKPFDTFIKLGKVSGLLNITSGKRSFGNFLRGILLLVLVVIIFIVPAIKFNGYITHKIPLLRNTITIGVLPVWAKFSMIILLPLAQAFIEFPWFYGYIYPRLENQLLENKKSKRIAASIKALLIVVIFFVLQAALIPLVTNPLFIFWKGLSMFPLLFTIGIIIRLVPRSMPVANILHALMAISVVLEYWKL